MFCICQHLRRPLNSQVVFSFQVCNNCRAWYTNDTTKILGLTLYRSIMKNACTCTIRGTKLNGEKEGRYIWWVFTCARFCFASYCFDYIISSYSRDCIEVLLNDTGQIGQNCCTTTQNKTCKVLGSIESRQFSLTSILSKRQRLALFSKGLCCRIDSSSGSSKLLFTDDANIRAPQYGKQGLTKIIDYIIICFLLFCQILSLLCDLPRRLTRKCFTYNCSTWLAGHNRGHAVTALI